MDSNLLKKQSDFDKTNVEHNLSLLKSNESTVDGIEILVDMARSGKIDPWNIDISDVTDKYLQKLVELKANNLMLTGRTLFFAALLLRLKSDILEGISFLDEVQVEEQLLSVDIDFDDDADVINSSNVISLEEVLERRTSVRLYRQRVVTLEELIKQLEFYEKLDRNHTLKNKQIKAARRHKSYENLSSEDIVNMAHDEYIEKSIKKLQEILEKLFETDDKIEMSELQKTGMDKVSVYIALLFLAAGSRFDLYQEEFYSDIFVVKES